MKRTTRSAVVAGLAILAVALAAATLEPTPVPEGSGPGEGGGQGDGRPLPLSPPAVESGATVQIPFLSELLTLLAVAATLAVLAYLFLHWRRTLGIALVILALFALSVVLFQFLSPPVSPPGRPMVGSENGSLLDGGGGGDAEATRPPIPPLVVLIVVGLALVGAVVALLRTRVDDDEPSAPSDGGDASAAAVGRAAGRAADRIEEEADVDNEVYRAWREMTELLDVEDPETSTPGEFAAAAVDAGIRREDVGELTRLFEDVRYGETRPSEEHERRATAVFRRIEAQYAEEAS